LGDDKAKRVIKEAAALQYNPEANSSPKVIALGKGDIAEKIIEKAHENNIPIVQDSNLAHTLNELNLGDEIPSELYEVVAEILVFISNIDRGYGEKYGRNK
jgi:flagellar biosynthesis protein